MDSDEELYNICLNVTNEEIAAFAICNYSNEYDSGERLEKVVSWVVPICFGLIGIVGLVGNALVVLVVAANPGMRSTTNLLIINLAVADLLFVIFCVPFTATDYVMPRWPFGDWWCKVVQYFIVVTAHASVYTLVLMSLDRFMAVVHPIASMSIRTERNALLAIACIWVVILTTAIPVGVCHGEREYSYYHRNHSSCVFLEEQGYSKLGFQMSFFLSSYVIPLALISFLYMCMLIRLWKSAPGGRVSAESRRGRKKVTRMVVVVVVVFAVCWCPIQIILLVKALDAFSINVYTVTAQIVSHVLAYMNSCVNPLLYAFLSENFRVAFRKDLRLLLNSTLEGKGLLNLDKTVPLNNAARLSLVRIIGTSILRQNPEQVVRSSVYASWAHAIVRVFPQEKPSVYFHTKVVESTRGIITRLAGKLPDQIHNLKRKYRDSGVVEKRRRISGSSESSRSPAPSLRLPDGITDEEDSEEKLFWLKNSTEPWTAVEHKWEETTQARLNKSKELTIAQYFGEYTALKKPKGYLLVMYCPPTRNDVMFSRPQATKTTRCGNGNSCHDIV